MPITAFYAALLTPIFILLSFRVIALRRSGQTALGDGGDPLLLRRMRVQANFAEYAPFGLILLGLAESLQAPHWWVHVLGLVLLVGRSLHAFGVSQTKETIAVRATGMVMTFLMLGATALTCLGGAILAW